MSSAGSCCHRQVEDRLHRVARRAVHRVAARGRRSRAERRAAAATPPSPRGGRSGSGRAEEAAGERLVHDRDRRRARAVARRSKSRPARSCVPISPEPARRHRVHPGDRDPLSRASGLPLDAGSCSFQPMPLTGGTSETDARATPGHRGRRLLAPARRARGDPAAPERCASTLTSRMPSRSRPRSRDGEAREGAEEEARGEDEDERERDLGDHQAAAERALRSRADGARVLTHRIIAARDRGAAQPGRGRRGALSPSVSAGREEEARSSAARRRGTRARQRRRRWGRDLRHEQPARPTCEGEAESPPGTARAGSR